MDLPKISGAMLNKPCLAILRHFNIFAEFKNEKNLDKNYNSPSSQDGLLISVKDIG
jgi:hypothetical protein